MRVRRSPHQDYNYHRGSYTRRNAQRLMSVVDDDHIEPRIHYPSARYAWTQISSHRKPSMPVAVYSVTAAATALRVRA